jgi:eukaryotic-like serine/threonine-protein kinase
VDAKNLVGSTLDNRYEVTRVIGAGGMGAVYEATHTGTGRRVAVKVISTGDVTRDAGLVGRFQREAKAAGAIATQHICQVLDTGTDSATGWPYMVMEFMEGEDVQHLVRRLGIVSPELALRIVAQSCVGLAKAHGAGVVHRDIKPANLFLSKGDDGRVVVKLLDFGIAKVKMEHASETGDAGLTRTGTMLGSPLYMSPEQARGMKTIDHRADIWSLGIVLYELLCGRTPYHHIEALGELIIAICSEPPQPVQEFGPWIPPDAAKIVHKALRAQPAERFQTAQEMLDAIKACLPSGFDINEDMLVGLSEIERSDIARRISITPPPQDGRPSLSSSGDRPSNVAARSVPPPGATQINTGTTEGVATPTERQPSSKGRSNTPFIALGLAVAVIGGGFAAFKFTGAESAGQPPPETVPLPTAPTQMPNVTPSTPQAATAPPVVNPTEKDKTFFLVILPEDAKVDVDGQPAEVNRGAVKVTGPLGSMHEVQLTIGKQSVKENVVISDSGLMPPKIELEVKAGGALRVVKPGGSAAPNTPSTPTSKPGPGPGIEQKFGD